MVEVGPEEIREVAELVAHDLLATLDWPPERAMLFARERAQEVAESLNRNQDDDDEDSVPPHYFAFCVAEEAQLVVHDYQWDTSWPTCPNHPHPMWLRSGDHPLVWRCRNEGAVAPLGGLPDGPVSKDASS